MGPWRRVFMQTNGRIMYLDPPVYESDARINEIKNLQRFMVLVDLPRLVIVVDFKDQLHIMWKEN